MIKLLTSNPKKYENFKKELDFLQLRLELTKENLTEIQTESFEESITYKAIEAEKKYNEPVFVDDSGLLIEQFTSFPGVNTKLVLKQLGKDGLKKLLQGCNKTAKIITVLAISISGKVFIYEGIVQGSLNFDSKVKDTNMILSDIFIADNKNENIFQHRLIALKKLQNDILNIHIEYDLLKNKTLENQFCTNNIECPFCIEFEDINKSIFYSLTENKIKNRIIYEDKYFIVIVPLGLFIEGGLLLLSKEHIHSFAHLDKIKYQLLTELVEKIKPIIEEIFGVMPIIFEHSSSMNRTKGKCCVDHAHLNIFPVDIDINKYITDRFYSKISNINELSKLKLYDNGYLYIDSSKNGKVIFDGANVPTQLIRMYLTKELGCEERWHWKDYLGIEEMKETFLKLSGKIV